MDKPVQNMEIFKIFLKDKIKDFPRKADNPHTRL